ncbi:hypothetical protein T4D_16908 [Trichinella pseudospiralis]|uniref:Uncharacterized protein n=1 Tax=Trichinella pseudospiralis TaxID=6337 RepID=A0A0V1FZ22_TRIPS|nr:hypothetical protein T4D_16908 [Trichinella pseudospiralis]
MIRANAISLIVASMSKGSRSSSRSRRSKMHQNLRRRRRFTSSKKIRFSMGKQAKKSRSSSRSSSSKLSLSEGYLLAYCVACNQPVGWLALCPDSKFHTPRYMEFQKKSMLRKRHKMSSRQSIRSHSPLLSERVVLFKEKAEKRKHHKRIHRSHSSKKRRSRSRTREPVPCRGIIYDIKKKF